MRTGFFSPMMTLDASMVRAFLRKASQSGDRELVRARFLNERKTFQWMVTWTLVPITMTAFFSLFWLGTCIPFSIALATDRTMSRVGALFVFVLLLCMFAASLGGLVYVVRLRSRFKHNLWLLDSEYAKWQVG
jgi:ABC-type multidrug transport system fused ATPase/permease subunit